MQGAAPAKFWPRGVEGSAGNVRVQKNHGPDAGELHKQLAQKTAIYVTKLVIWVDWHWGCSSFGRAPASHAGGTGFDYLLLHGEH